MREDLILHIEFLTEEVSAQAVLQQLLPKILGEHITFDIRVYRGKPDLIKKLPERLKGYKSWIPPEWRIVVLIDEDREDCQNLKAKLEEIAKDAGFVTKTSARQGESFQVLNRIAVEELEAWFFGDISAICAAYPKMSASLGAKSSYRDPDAISGGTAEALERVLRKAGYHSGGLEKVKAAKEIYLHMIPEQNNSKSFQIFRDGLKALIAH